MNGQISIFDFPEFLPEADFEIMTIKEAAEIISGRTGLKFELAKSLNENKETYSAKKKGLEIRIEFANYMDGVRGGIRHLGVDYSFGTGGGAKPCESIDEAVEYIQEKIDSLISVTKCMDPPGATLLVSVKGMLDDGYCPKCNINLDDLIEECPDCHNKLDWSDWKMINER